MLILFLPEFCVVIIDETPFLVKLESYKVGILGINKMSLSGLKPWITRNPLIRKRGYSVWDPLSKLEFNRGESITVKFYRKYVEDNMP